MSRVQSRPTHYIQVFLSRSEDILFAVPNALSGSPRLLGGLVAVSFFEAHYIIIQPLTRPLMILLKPPELPYVYVHILPFVAVLDLDFPEDYFKD